MPISRVLPFLVLGALAAGCTTYRDELARSQTAFEKNDPDRTLALLRDLEPNLRRLTVPEQAEYAYLRGMTDFTIGYKADARHWLSVAKASEDASPGVLAGDRKARTVAALKELNEVVYNEGTAALTTARQPTDATPDAAPAPPAAAPSKDAGAKDPELPPK